MIDQAVANAVDRIGPQVALDRLGFTPPREDAEVLATIRSTADRLSALMGEIVDLEDSDPRSQGPRDAA